VDDLAYHYHENMVIWKKKEAWNGFGFLGESGRGKTPLSFAIARLLFTNGEHAIKVIDDCFELEEGKISQCRCWGSRDQLGETYYQELLVTLNSSGHSIDEVNFGKQQFPLYQVTMFLLLISEDIALFRRVRCTHEKFVQELLKTNPFTWNEPKPGRDVVFHGFKESWEYSIVHRQKDTTQELIDALAEEALKDYKNNEGSAC
jgi:hypothetical protein